MSRLTVFKVPSIQLMRSLASIAPLKAYKRWGKLIWLLRRMGRRARVIDTRASESQSIRNIKL